MLSPLHCLKYISIHYTILFNDGMNRFLKFAGELGYEDGSGDKSEHEDENTDNADNADIIENTDSVDNEYYEQWSAWSSCANQTYKYR